jgi:hypothetical protein
MERQGRKRIPVNFQAELIVNGKSYTGVIENLSECGTCISASLTEFAIIIPGTTLEIKFASSEIGINLRCTVMWVLMNKDKISEGLRYKMGMEIIEEPAPEYIEFLKTLYT